MDAFVFNGQTRFKLKGTDGRAYGRSRVKWSGVWIFSFFCFLTSRFPFFLLSGVAISTFLRVALRFLFFPAFVLVSGVWIFSFFCILTSQIRFLLFSGVAISIFLRVASRFLFFLLPGVAISVFLVSGVAISRFLGFWRRYFPLCSVSGVASSCCYSFWRHDFMLFSFLLSRFPVVLVSGVAISRFSCLFSFLAAGFSVFSAF